jgi:hypothetical protein
MLCVEMHFRNNTTTVQRNDFGDPPKIVLVFVIEIRYIKHEKRAQYYADVVRHMSLLFP